MTMTGSYDFGLVALSYVVSVVGSFMALKSARGIPVEAGAGRAFPLAAAAFSMGGCGIWSMHFIGMIAFEMPMPMSYDWPLTIASMILAMVVTGIGFHIVRRPEVRRVHYAVAGVVMGLGISSMHYTGMAAMRMPARIEYDPLIVALSVFIGIAAATAALWLSFHVERTLSMLCCSLVMAVAVCGMHYVGMAAAEFIQTDEVLPLESQALRPEALAYLVFLFTIVALSIQIGVAAAWRAERLAENA